MNKVPAAKHLSLHTGQFRLKFTTVLLLLNMIAGAVYAQEEFLLFHSGFEPGVYVGEDHPSWASISGTDNSITPPNDWDALYTHPRIDGGVAMIYEGGDLSQRYSRVIEDPTQPGNHVLQFWMQEPHVSFTGCDLCKGRIQLTLNWMTGFYEMRQVNRMYLPEDWALMREQEYGWSWMTLIEFWNEGNWYNDEHPFRLGVNMSKAAGAGSPFHFGMGGQIGIGEDWETVWHESNTDFEVPVGKWMTFEYIFVEGTDETGHLVFNVTVEGEEPVTIFDVHNFTHHPYDPSPDGLTLHNPLKLYTSADTINVAKNLGIALEIYWDDLAIYTSELEKVDTIGALKAGVVGNNQVTFAWEDVMENEDGYRILRKGPDEDLFHIFAETEPDTTSYTTAPGEIVPFESATYAVEAYQRAATSKADNEILLVLKDSAPPDNFTTEAESIPPVDPWEIVEDEDALGGRYLQGAKNSAFARFSPPSDGNLQYTFTTRLADDFQIHMRSAPQNAGSDSFWIRMDEGDWIKFEMGEPYGNEWTWRTVTDEQGGILVNTLEPGEHTLTVAYREGFTPLDAIIVVSSTTPYYPVNPILEFFADADNMNKLSWNLASWDTTIWSSNWWGTFESSANTFPYVRHDKYGWVYCAGLSGLNGFWFWDYEGDLGWNYTSSLLHPLIYNYNRGEWLYAYPDLNNWYYSYAMSAPVQIGNVANPYIEDLVQEAEDGEILGAFVVAEDPGASGSKYVQAERGLYNFVWPDACRLVFTVAEAGSYRIKTWARAANGTSDTMFVKVNGQPDGEGRLWSAAISNVFVEDYVTDGDSPEPLAIDLKPGLVVVEFLLREVGCQLDKVELEKQ